VETTKQLQDDRRSRRAVGLFEERFGAVPSVGSALDRLVELVDRFNHLPYENLSKILSWEGGAAPPRLRLPEEVMRDHIVLGTGGTCYSLTELLRQLARAAGFTCHPVMAHMRHGENIHCALRVEVGDRAYLVDPGYLVRRPLPMADSDDRTVVEIGDPLLVPVGRHPDRVPQEAPRGDFDLFTVEEEGPRWRYRFSVRAPTEQEFITHWNESFHLPGMRSLVVTRRAPDGQRLYLHNHKLRRRGGASSSTENVRQVLDQTVEDLFGIDPEITRRAWELIRRQRQRWRAKEGGDGP
jgi:arylamine N-acetyltransferase